jgi:putative SOS response-associated peptidase YedK
MCGGVEYLAVNPKTGQLESRKTYFPIPQAQLPVIGSKGAALITWGRRNNELPSSDLPSGGWARLDSLQKGRWKKYQPVPVVIPVKRFMEKDAQGKSHWFDLNEDQLIEGIGVVMDGKPFVYVVTVEDDGSGVHARAPKVISKQEAEELLDFAWDARKPWLNTLPAKKSED